MDNANKDALISDFKKALLEKFKSYDSMDYDSMDVAKEDAIEVSRDIFSVLYHTELANNKNINVKDFNSHELKKVVIECYKEAFPNNSKPIDLDFFDVRMMNKTNKDPFNLSYLPSTSNKVSNNVMGLYNLNKSAEDIQKIFEQHYKNYNKMLSKFTITSNENSKKIDESIIKTKALSSKKNVGTILVDSLNEKINENKQQIGLLNRDIKKYNVFNLMFSKDARQHIKEMNASIKKMSLENQGNLEKIEKTQKEIDNIDVEIKKENDNFNTLNQAQSRTIELNAITMECSLKSHEIHANLDKIKFNAQKIDGANKALKHVETNISRIEEKLQKILHSKKPNDPMVEELVKQLENTKNRKRELNAIKATAKETIQECTHNIKSLEGDIKKGLNSAASLYTQKNTINGISAKTNIIAEKVSMVKNVLIKSIAETVLEINKVQSQFSTTFKRVNILPKFVTNKLEAVIDKAERKLEINQQYGEFKKQIDAMLNGKESQNLSKSVNKNSNSIDMHH